MKDLEWIDGPGLSGGPNEITRVLRGQEHQCQEYLKMLCCGLCKMMTVTLRQGMQAASRSWKIEGNRFSSCYESIQGATTNDHQLAGA